VASTFSVFQVNYFMTQNFLIPQRHCFTTIT